MAYCHTSTGAARADQDGPSLLQQKQRGSSRLSHILHVTRIAENQPNKQIYIRYKKKK